jgi:hypothetical protein
MKNSTAAKAHKGAQSSHLLAAPRVLLWVAFTNPEYIKTAGEGHVGLLKIKSHSINL